jgi:hypothetical protein
MKYDPGMYVLNFGKPQYRGKTLDEIATTDAGLLYLDELVEKEFLWSSVRDAILAYLELPVIKEELRKLIN